MPTYSYACTECADRFDVVQAFTDDALTTCEKCSGRLRKLFDSVGVVFKGSGFYRTDSRESGKKSRARPTGRRVEQSGRVRAPVRASRRAPDKSEKSDKSRQQLHAGHGGRLELASYPPGYPQRAPRPALLPCAPPSVCGVAEPSLNPTLFSRISVWLRPDWTRTVLARRVAAGGLVVLAGVAALRSNPDDDRAEVVVAARDLRPGTALTSDDVRLEKRSATTVPDGSRADLGAVVGSTLASPTRRGEVLTDVRLLGSRLAESNGRAGRPHRAAASGRQRADRPGPGG